MAAECHYTYAITSQAFELLSQREFSGQSIDSSLNFFLLKLGKRARLRSSECFLLVRSQVRDLVATSRVTKLTPTISLHNHRSMVMNELSEILSGSNFPVWQRSTPKFVSKYSFLVVLSKIQTGTTGFNWIVGSAIISGVTLKFERN